MSRTIKFRDTACRLFTTDRKQWLEQWVTAELFHADTVTEYFRMLTQRKITTLEQMWTLKETEVCAQTELLCSPIFLFCWVCIVLYNSTEELNTGNQFATATPEKNHCTKIHHSMILGLVFIGLIKVRSIHSARKMECILYNCARKNQYSTGILLYKAGLRRFCLHHRKTPNCSCLFKTLFIPMGQLNTKLLTSSLQEQQSESGGQNLTCMPIRYAIIKLGIWSLTVKLLNPK